MSKEPDIPARTNQGEFTLFDDPNRYARPAGIEISDYQVILHGYQEFTLTPHAFCIAEVDRALQRKYDLLQPYFDPQVVTHRSVLDLGAAGGFFCFWAAQNGAESAVALDIDEKYLSLIKRAAERMDYTAVQAVCANVMEWDRPADITVALALIHWIYSCTADYGSLDLAVKKIAGLTRYMSIIEWVEPDDAAINMFHHIDWNAEHVQGVYSLSEFKNALDTHFARHSYIGDISPTRKLYAAFKTPYTVNFTASLPLLMPESTIISSRSLVTYNEIDYWSRVYDAGGHILKQAALDLASREAYFLDKFDNSYFPHVLGSELVDGWSSVKLEKIQGIPLADALGEISGSADRFYTFITHCLEILGCLEREGITHRDIRMDNIIMRDGRPVLIDFGWAVSPRQPYFAPAALGEEGRPPDGIFCDIYSMGKLLGEINGRKYAQFDGIIGLMTETDAALRVTSLKTLGALFSRAAGKGPD